MSGTKDLHQIVYISTATTAVGREEAIAQQMHFAENNKRRAITGILLYRAGNFMQVIEGDKTVVRELYTKIEADPRHQDVVQLLDEPIVERAFPNWSMGMEDLDSEETRAKPGWNAFLTTPLTAREFFGKPGKVKRLLDCFKHDNDT